MPTYLDTNAFYFFFFEDQTYSAGIKTFFDEMQQGQQKGVTSALTLDELSYVVLLRLIEKKYNKHPLDVIRSSKQSILEFIPQIQKMFDVIFSLHNLLIMDATLSSVGLIPFTMEEHCLLPRDALHAITARNAGCPDILSTDSDFDTVQGLHRIDPAKFGTSDD
ncbi:type II toxin-antitoxin system VapC family toxin [Candidatus Woesearchaeota archaeon]|nr:type II toxin-antitoxin system VapC family toxin [Candidatus Woesearchaeota archaeon]